MKTTFAEVGRWHLSVQNLQTRKASNKVADVDVMCVQTLQYTFRDVLRYGAFTVSTELLLTLRV